MTIALSDRDSGGQRPVALRYCIRSILVKAVIQRADCERWHRAEGHLQSSTLYLRVAVQAKQRTKWIRIRSCELP